MDHLGGARRYQDPDGHYPELWDWMLERYRVRTILDIGCGRGYTIQYFKSKGCETIGVEGHKRWSRWGPQPIINHDLITGPCKVPIVDLVWCCEVVEHIEAQYVQNIVETMRCGRIVAMTHTLPGYRGYHHVNCQDSQYWIDLLANGGFVFLGEDTKQSRTMAHGYWLRSGLIFQNPEPRSAR